MTRCRLLRLGARLLPFRRAQRRWLAHAARCARCAASLAGREEAGSFVVRTGDVGAASVETMWTRVRAEIVTEGAGDGAGALRPRFAGTLRRVLHAWVRPALVAAVLFAAGLGLFQAIRGRAPEDVPDIRVESLQAGGGPVTPIIVRPSGSNVTVIWAARSID